MFQEINPSFFKERDKNKSWFRDAENNCELFIWRNGQNQIIRFQLWYEDALIEWDLRNGFKSGILDPEVGAFRSYQSPSYRYHTHFVSGLISKIKTILNSNAENKSVQDALHFVQAVMREKQ